jgi:UPF0176 protein
LPDHVHEIEHLKDKKIITYCTGGIKCEKASAYLIEKGFENVYQLHGGIIKYGLEEGGEDFEGKCYVFDNRVTTSVNTVNPEVISKCHICETISDHMVNCANPECNEHVPICPSCLEKWKVLVLKNVKITLANVHTILLVITANSLTTIHQNLDSKVVKKQT